LQVELSDLAAQVKRLGAAHQTRRTALRRLGVGSVAVGLLTAVGAHSGRAQTWDGLTPTAESAPGASAIPPAPIAGVSGGLPPFAYALEASAPIQYPAGTVRWATNTQLPTLQGAAFAAERLGAGGLRELHWHLNAHELTCCLAGQGRIGIFAPDGTWETLDIGPGSLTFVPSGYTHYIQNTSSDDLHVLTAFTHEQPETTDLSQALPGIPTPLLAQTFGVAANAFPFLATRGDRFIVSLPEAGPDEPAGTPAAAAPSAYSTTVDQLPVVTFAGGTVQPLTTQQIPRLQGITVFPLKAVPYGLREPHWHANASELDYFVSGHAQIGLVAPDGNLQTVTVGPGDIAFLPQNWFHYIASVSDEPLQILIFFLTPDPRVETLTLSQTFDTVPARVLAASFDGDPDQFAALPKRGTVGIAPPVAADT
jgi:oxalate decarboxylase